MGVDPGETTGFCVCRYINEGPTFTLKVVESVQERHSFAMPDRYLQMLTIFKPDLVVMESIVTTGQLNKEKMAQIQTHDRITVITRARDMLLEEVTPQAVKRVKSVPKGVKGPHARDAYRVVAAYFRAKGQYESGTDVETGQTRSPEETTS